MTQSQWPAFPGTNSAPSADGGGSGGPGMCENCRVRPKYVESGRAHPYCGRTCAQAAKASGQAQSPASLSQMAAQQMPDDQAGQDVADEIPIQAPKAHQDIQQAVADRLCKHCHQRRRMIVDGFQQDYCSDDCARKGPTERPAEGPGLTMAPVTDEAPHNPAALFASATNFALAMPMNRSLASKAPAARHITYSNQRHCMICGRSCYVSPYTGHISEFCSNEHRLEAIKRKLVEPCLRCRHWPKEMPLNSKRGDFCGKNCASIIANAAPVLLELDPQSEAYKSVVNQFTAKWLHKTKCPRVLRILKVYEDQSLNDLYRAYKDRIHKKHGGFAGRPYGNEQRRWHGTDRECTIGDPGKPIAFCNQPNCAVCMICKTSFKLIKSGTHFAWGRFGHGIYLSSTTSKSNDYVRSHGKNRQPGQLGALILSRVVCGLVKKYTTDQPNLKEAPNPYDCVIGEPTPGSSVNYDEEIVYDNDAVRPAYIVIYNE